MNEWYKDIKKFDWRELDGKVMRVYVGESDGALAVMLRCDETGVAYLVHSENNYEKD